MINSGLVGAGGWHGYSQSLHVGHGNFFSQVNLFVLAILSELASLPLRLLVGIWETKLTSTTKAFNS